MDARKEKVLNELRDDIVKEIGLFNKALKENNFSEMTAVEARLKEAESEYANTKATAVYDELSGADEPLKAAVIRHSYYVLAHKNIRDNGVLVRVELADDKEKQIDLVKLAKYLKLDVSWKYKVEKFNQLLCLRAAQELKLSKAEVQKICDSFYMDKLSKAVELGETPSSNTQICKQLQSIVDSMVFEDNGSGKNKYKVNNHDVAYLLMRYTQKGKSALSVAVAKHSYLHQLIMNIEHRIILGKQYSLDYKIANGNSEPAKEEITEVPKVSENEEKEIEKK